MAAQNCEITVTGQGVHVLPAERAVLILKVQSNEVESQKEATAIVTATANTLREMIHPLYPTVEGTGRAADDAAIVHYAMTTMGTASVTKYNKDWDESKPRFCADVEFHIKFRNFGAINGFATKVSAMDNVAIGRISWNLTDETLLTATAVARKAAGRSAVQKAHDFAQAVCGVEESACAARIVPVEVTENWSYAHSTRPQLHFGKALRGTSTGDHELQFEPEDVSVEIAINISFEVIKP